MDTTQKILLVIGIIIAAAGFIFHIVLPDSRAQKIGLSAILFGIAFCAGCGVAMLMN